jgi:hypothetical protein
MESGSLPPPIVLEVKDDQLLAGFKTVFGAMELCDAITKIMVKPFQQTSNIRISLHVGPIHINPEIAKQELSGDVISMIERLHALYFTRLNLCNRYCRGGFGARKQKIFFRLYRYATNASGSKGP